MIIYLIGIHNAVIMENLRFMPKTSVKIVWHETNDMPTSLATSLTVIRRFSKIIFVTGTMCSSVVHVFGRPEQVSSLTSSQLNLCSAHRKLTKHHSQHFNCPCTFNFTF